MAQSGQFTCRVMFPTDFRPALFGKGGLRKKDIDVSSRTVSTFITESPAISVVLCKGQSEHDVNLASNLWKIAIVKAKFAREEPPQPITRPSSFSVDQSQLDIETFYKEMFWNTVL